MEKPKKEEKVPDVKKTGKGYGRMSAKRTSCCKGRLKKAPRGKD